MKNRISILDGFRAIAIISVILFHFFSRYTPPWNKISLYPYQNRYSHFNYGYLGVHFFFIISGFVIFFTIDHTSSFLTFWKKRLVRLMPSIILGSLFTLIFLTLFDKTNLFPNGHSVRNFFVSITFISPSLLNNIFSELKLNAAYLNGSYWSLWPEIQFYLFSSLIFYFMGKNFLRNFLLLSFILILINNLFVHTDMLSKYAVLVAFYEKWSSKGFNLPEYMPFFSIGVVFYQFFKNKELKTKSAGFEKLYLLTILILLLITSGSNGIRVVYIAMYVSFLCFIYYPQRMTIFNFKILTKIGEGSYILYLLHESVGVFLIYKLGKYFLPVGFIFPLILIILFIIVSHLFTIYIDKKINKWLRTQFNI